MGHGGDRREEGETKVKVKERREIGDKDSDERRMERESAE